jgi:hypothetical protein
MPGTISRLDAAHTSPFGSYAANIMPRGCLLFLGETARYYQRPFAAA